MEIARRFDDNTLFIRTGCKSINEFSRIFESNFKPSMVVSSLWEIMLKLIHTHLVGISTVLNTTSIYKDIFLLVIYRVNFTLLLIMLIYRPSCARSNGFFLCREVYNLASFSNGTTSKIIFMYACRHLSLNGKKLSKQLEHFLNFRYTSLRILPIH